MSQHKVVHNGKMEEKLFRVFPVSFTNNKKAELLCIQLHLSYHQSKTHRCPSPQKSIIK